VEVEIRPEPSEDERAAIVAALAAEAETPSPPVLVPEELETP
jgi:hypothetical protein